MTIPVLAVVGFVNMGKSSLVASLTETDAIAIAPRGGTTTACQRFACEADGEILFELTDTPGFQAARRCLRWMEDWLDERGDDSVTGPDAVRAFLAANRGSAVFVNEVALLEPIIEGAGILYVVDADLPYKARYEAEMRILAMTGRPRMGVINLRQAASHQDTWREALSPNFAKVVALDVVSATRDQRRAVLRSFAGIDDSWQAAFERATDRLGESDHERARRIAAQIRHLVVTSLSAETRCPLPKDGERSRAERDLREQLKRTLVKAELRCRQAVERESGFTRLERTEANLEVLDQGLFTKEVWRLLGLSRSKLIATSTASGAGIGALVDLGVGGLSVGTGALIGAGIGFASGLAAIGKRFSVRVLGADLFDQGPQLAMRAPGDLKWASVVLDRALIHYRLVSQRSHARQDRLEVSGASILDTMPKQQLTELAKLVDRTAKSEGSIDDELERRWQQWLETALAGSSSAG
ncbi:MAG: GTPase/DUF3482 domain-containing protein [Planctomycetota bacterium]|jgi:GTPase SAR1 family protein|nr:GTPase/DUF3482 domain-containing protein [Planctomycetota bacterium]